MTPKEKAEFRESKLRIIAEHVVEERKARYKYLARAIATVAVCAAGAATHWHTGETGIGWAIFGTMVIWGAF